MATISWKESYNIGIEIIDDQHKQLVNFICEIDKAITEKKQSDILAKILSDLYDFMHIHFMTEENMLKETDYAETDSHIREHEIFMVRIHGFITDFQSGHGDLSMDIMSFLVDWLISHICGTDRKYKKHLLEHGIK